MGSSTNASGNYSMAMGIETESPSFAETVIGQHNTDYTPSSTSQWEPNDRLFVIGNGSDANNKSDAMVVRKNGNIGIGTSNPIQKLDVNGDINIIGNVRINEGQQLLFYDENQSARGYLKATIVNGAPPKNSY